MPTVTKKVREETPTKRFIREFISSGHVGIKLKDSDPKGPSIRKALSELDVGIKYVERDNLVIGERHRFLINTTRVHEYKPTELPWAEIVQRAGPVRMGTATSAISLTYGCGHTVNVVNGDDTHHTCPYCYVAKLNG